MVSLFLSLCLSFVTADVAFESKNYPGYYWGLNGNEAIIDQSMTPWILLYGLCGVENSRSFHTAPSYDYYLRHRNYLLYQERSDGSSLFEEDACFIRRENYFFPGYTAYESVNYPNHFIRHEGYRLKISLNDGSGLFKEDASFKLKVSI